MKYRIKYSDKRKEFIPQYKYKYIPFWFNYKESHQGMGFSTVKKGSWNDAMEVIRHSMDCDLKAKKAAEEKGWHYKEVKLEHFNYKNRPGEHDVD